MWSNTKLLVIACFLIIFLGLGLLWFGGQPVQIQITPSPAPISDTSFIATGSAAQVIDGEKLLVTRVVDGDTIQLQNGKTVRFIGIDTPETVDPRRPVGCFGKEASNEAKKLMDQKIVILEKDISETDKYNRLLRYVYLSLENGQTLFVNDYLVREGYAKASTYPPDVKFTQQFLEAEKEARVNKKGLWGKCN